MTERIHHLRSLDDESPCEPPQPVETRVPDRHVLMLVKRAAEAAERGDFQAVITELSHAVYVGATKGLQGATDFDLIRELRSVAGFGFPWDDPDRAA